MANFQRANDFLKWKIRSYLKLGLPQIQRQPMAIWKDNFRHCCRSLPVMWCLSQLHLSWVSEYIHRTKSCPCKFSTDQQMTPRPHSLKECGHLKILTQVLSFTLFFLCLILLQQYLETLTNKTSPNITQKDKYSDDQKNCHLYIRFCKWPMKHLLRQGNAVCRLMHRLTNRKMVKSSVCGNLLKQANASSSLKQFTMKATKIQNRKKIKSFGNMDLLLKKKQQPSNKKQDIRTKAALNIIPRY